jgi:hypothetical protein
LNGCFAIGVFRWVFPVGQFGIRHGGAGRTVTFSGQARVIPRRTGKPWFDADEQRDSISVCSRLALSGQAPLLPSVRIAAGISEESDGATRR